MEKQIALFCVLLVAARAIYAQQDSTLEESIIGQGGLVPPLPLGERIRGEGVAKHLSSLPTTPCTPLLCCERVAKELKSP